MFNLIKRQLGVSKPQKRKEYHVDIFVNQATEDSPYLEDKHTFEVHDENPEEAVQRAIKMFKHKFPYCCGDCSGKQEGLKFRVDAVYQEIYPSVDIPCLSETNEFVHYPKQVSS